MSYTKQSVLLACQQEIMTTCMIDDNLSCWQSIMPSPKRDSLKYCLQAIMQACYRLMMIIAIANSKGGVGKSTVAVHLAAWLHEQGYRVTLADCDTQQSSSEWVREAVPGIKAVRLDNPDVILNELPLLAADTDFVIADGPGSQTETSRATFATRRPGHRSMQGVDVGGEGTGKSHGSASRLAGHPIRLTQGGHHPQHGR